MTGHRNLFIATLVVAICLIIGAGISYLGHRQQSVNALPSGTSGPSKSPIVNNPSFAPSYGPIKKPMVSDEFRPTSGALAKKVYDPRGRLIAVVYHDGTVETYTYNAEGGIIRKTNRTGEVISAQAGKTLQIEMISTSTKPSK
jgi:YD repeat-containing protein